MPGSSQYGPTHTIPTVAADESVDAFGRLRVSSPVNILNTTLQYDQFDGQWVERVTGGATATHQPNVSSCRLAVTGAIGDRMIRQTKRYMRYTPGRSQQIIVTAALGAGVAGIRKRLGYYDDENGVFFELNGTALRCVIRSFATGVAVDTVIEQAAWNGDPMDGTGPSGKTLDTSMTNLYIMNFAWLGVGSVQFRVEIDRVSYVVHTQHHANNLPVPYMTTGNLPCRYEIEDLVGIGAVNDTFLQICMSVSSEGGETSPAGEPRSVTVDPTTPPSAPAGALTSILSMRLKQTFKTLKNRADLIPLLFALNPAPVTGSRVVHWVAVLNPTITLTTWIDPGSEHVAEICRDAVTYTGGTIIGEGFISATRQSVPISSVDANSLIHLSRDIDGLDPDVLVFAAQTVDGSAVDVYGVAYYKQIT